MGNRTWATCLVSDFNDPLHQFQIIIEIAIEKIMNSRIRIVRSTHQVKFWSCWQFSLFQLCSVETLTLLLSTLLNPNFCLIVGFESWRKALAATEWGQMVIKDFFPRLLNLSAKNWSSSLGPLDPILWNIFSFNFLYACMQKFKYFDRLVFIQNEFLFKHLIY